MTKYMLASFFTGVGGIDLGFHQANNFETVFANELDPYPAQTFRLNFPNIHLLEKDICLVEPQDVPEVDGYVFGFPCQAFSVAGLRLGFDDPKNRGNLFFEVMRIAHEHKPRFLFAENVKGLINHDNGNTLQVILETLKSEGYYATYRVLNAYKYGNIPQNRERIYVAAFREKEDFQNYEWPDEIPLTVGLRDIIDFDEKKEDEYYYTPGKYAGNIYEKLVEATEKEDVDNPGIYQWRRWYVRKNKKNLVPTLTANQGGGGHNVCIVKTKYGFRKMTPRECFNAQGFPKDFILPNMRNSRLYKQAGNSVCVPVVKRIAESIAQAMEKTDCEVTYHGCLESV